MAIGRPPKKPAAPAPSTALAIPPVPVTADQVAARTVAVRALVAEVAAITTIKTAEQYAAADRVLTLAVQLRDALVAERQSATGKLKAVVAQIEGWFRPPVRQCEDLIADVKGKIGAYRVEQEKARLVADAKVAAAAERGDNRGLVRALEASQRAASAGDAGRARVAMRWAVKSVDVDTMAKTAGGRAFLVVDEKAIEKWVNDQGRFAEDEAPQIAGVVFERVARVGARR